MDRYFGLQWHITNRCDQRCKHCYIFNKSGDRVPTSEFKLQDTFQTVEKFLAFCRSVDHKPIITITGGDPLLYPHIWEVLEYLNDIHLHFSILGNPFHLSEMVAERLRNLGCTSYQMSLDGLEHTHDEIRKPGSFRATLDKIKTLKDVGIRANIMTTVSSMNYLDLPQLTKVVVNSGATVFAFARYCPTHGDNEYNLSPAEYRCFLEVMWEVFKELADQGTIFTLKDHLWIPFLQEKGFFTARSEKIVFEGCGCGHSHMAVLEDGTVYACRRFESPVGNILSSNFEKIFLGREMSRYREVTKIVGCKDCDLLYYCRGCHAVSAGSTGDFFQPDPQCWR